MTNKNTLDTNVEKIRQEYKNGVPAKKLAKRHKVSVQSIYNTTSGRNYKQRGGAIFHRYKPVTTQERSEMRVRYANGQSLRDIAAQMSRPYATVYYWCVVRAEDSE
jgi:transposase